jgi:hypothetical protein
MDRGRNVRRRVAERAQLHSIDRASLLPMEVTLSFKLKLLRAGKSPCMPG